MSHTPARTAPPILDSMPYIKAASGHIFVLPSSCCLHAGSALGLCQCMPALKGDRHRMTTTSSGQRRALAYLHDAAGP